MRRWVITLALASSLCLISGWAGAGDFDGSRPLVLALFSVQECAPHRDCQAVDVEEAGLPRFLRIDFAGKVIRRAEGTEEGPTSAIERQESVGGFLHLQGAEEGRENMAGGFGWSLAIDQENGRAVLTAAGKETGFVAFGACLPQ
jgi:hypothetical protein